MFLYTGGVQSFSEIRPRTTRNQSPKPGLRPWARASPRRPQPWACRRASLYGRRGPYHVLVTNSIKWSQKASSLYFWATFNQLWPTSTLGYGGLAFWATWLSRFTAVSRWSKSLLKSMKGPVSKSEPQWRHPCCGHLRTIRKSALCQVPLAFGSTSAQDFTESETNLRASNQTLPQLRAKETLCHLFNSILQSKL